MGRSLMPRYQSALIAIASLDYRDFDAALASILRTDAQVIGVDRVSYWALTPERNELVCELGYVHSERVLERGNVVAKSDSPEYFEAIMSEQLIVAEDALADPRTRMLAASYLVPHGITSMMDAPVWHDGKFVGVVCHEHTSRRRKFSERDRAFALSAAQAVATAVGTRERKRAKYAEHRAAFLGEATLVLAENLDIDEILQRLVHLSVPMLGDWCVLEALQPDGTLRRIASAHVDPALQSSLDELALAYPTRIEGSSATARALRSGNAILQPEFDVCERAQDDRHRELLRRVGSHSIVAVPLRAHGAILGIVSFGVRSRSFGIDDLRLAEELARRAAIVLENAQLHRYAQEAIAARDEFLSVAAHELYTPLTSLTLAAEQLANVHAEDRMLRIVMRSARRLRQLVDSMLDAVRTGFDRVEVTCRDADLVVIVRTVVERLADTAERAGCTMGLEAPARVPGCWDERGIEQIVTNLLTNALKFGAGRPVEVTLAVQGDQVRVTVRDHGRGIDPAEMPRLFDRFARGVSSRSYGGLGLGLYIARTIAQAHGGTLRAESEPGEGATFVLDLPLRASHVAERASGAPPPEASKTR